MDTDVPAANFAEAAPEGNRADWAGFVQAASPGPRFAHSYGSSARAGEPEYEREARMEPLRITILCPACNQETVIPLFFARIRPVLQLLSERYLIELLLSR